MADSSEIWGKLEVDTEKSYAAFAAYRDLGPKRSLRTVAEQQLGFYVGETPAEYRRVGEPTFRPLTPEEETQIASRKRQMERWSTEDHWRKRVAAFDLEQDRIAQEKRQEQADDARERALSGAHLAQSIGLKAMHLQNSRLDGEVEANPSLNPLKVWKEGVEMEFIALGLPINVTKQQVEGTTPEQLEAQEYREKAQNASGAFRRARGRTQDDEQQS